MHEYGSPALARRSLLTALAVGSVAVGVSSRFGTGSAGAAPSDSTVGLRIDVAGGHGVGPTALASFDAALRAVGVANMNLIHLSSSIPSGAEVARTDRIRRQLAWGDRLYCVYSSRTAKTPGEHVAAGLGWVQREDGSGAGLFVEHDAPTGAQVELLIRASLGDMTAARDEAFGPVQLCVAEAQCVAAPATALVMAAYQTSSWD
ncbi:arginine decarboxylase [Nocardia tenerifensis]|uniref:Pyruvoyl-dependent arginine decarboxylase AaxB n=1 Tax=Nocardia tenerifensis TaxID=228006 RepID=A0A318KCF2_9NOCA|nr:pyruvoyl-dependent arginine decarboxylase [Nocardia tenerifensis]PXX63181.1 arginine decarboxylase [Nocardia tenerifensis]